VCSCRGRRLLKWRYRLWQRFVRGCAREVILRTATCTFEYRYGDGIRERLPRLAAELVGLPVNLLVTSAGPPALAAKQATKTIPIVFTQVSDPVAEGLVTSLARPGGNITGLSQTSSDLAGKRLELLSETFPKISNFAVLWTSASKAGRTRFQETQSAAQSLGLQVFQSTYGVRSDAPRPRNGIPDAALAITPPTPSP
jgi:putative ABC transport system substrate-binding protein